MCCTSLLAWFIVNTLIIHESGSVPVTTEGCSADQFQCHDGECIDQTWVCDHSFDCRDKSDELICEVEVTTGTTELTACKEDEFTCGSDNSCIPHAWVCDKAADCLDNTDELNCQSSQCEEDEAKCRQTGHCIKKQWICDGEADCIDNSDEENCPGLDDSDSAVSNSTYSYSENSVSSGSDSADFHSSDAYSVDFHSSDAYSADFETSTAMPRTVLTTKEDFDESVSENPTSLKFDEFSGEQLTSTEGLQAIALNESIWNTSSSDESTKEMTYAFDDVVEQSNENITSEDGSHQEKQSYGIPEFFTFATNVQYDYVDIGDVELSRYSEANQSVTTLSNDNFETVTETSDIPKSSIFPSTTTLSSVTTTIPPETTRMQTSTEEQLATSTTTSTTTTTPSTTTTSSTTTTTPTTTTSTTTRRTTTPNPCQRGEFFCRSDYFCIPVEWRCDHTADCWDGTDERNCDRVNCPREMVQCEGTGQCIYRAWVCDGTRDCDTGSDEIYCY